MRRERGRPWAGLLHLVSLCSLCYLLESLFLDRHAVAPVFLGSGPSRLAWPTSSIVSMPTSSPFSVTGSALSPLCCRMGRASSNRSAWGEIVGTFVFIREGALVSLSGEWAAAMIPSHVIMP